MYILDMYIIDRYIWIHIYMKLSNITYKNLPLHCNDFVTSDE